MPRAARDAPLLRYLPRFQLARRRRGDHMDHYTLIVVSDDRSPVRRFQVPTLWVQRAIWGNKLGYMPQ